MDSEQLTIEKQKLIKMITDLKDLSEKCKNLTREAREFLDHSKEKKSAEDLLADVE